MKKNKVERTIATVELPLSTHQKMKVHCAKLGMKLKDWIDGVVLNAVNNGE